MTVQEIKLELFKKDNFIQLPNKGGTVFKTQEVMRAITKYEELINGLQLKLRAEKRKNKIIRTTT